MDCRIEISGALRKGAGLARSEIRAAALFFAQKSSARVRVPFREVSIVLQDDAGSAAAHLAIMGIDGATDVITQGFDAIPPDPSGIYGELCVNVQRAVEAAPSRKGWSPAKELLLYVAHGMDHLSGADDLEDADRNRMRRRELSWLKEYAQKRPAGR